MGFPLPDNDPLGTDIMLDENGDIAIDVNGDPQLVTNLDNVAQAIRVNLTTEINTYMWDDDVGSYLPDYVDMPISDELQNEIIALVTAKAMQDDRVSDVTDVILDTSNPDTLIIFITCDVNGQGTVQIPIPVGGG